MTKYTFLAITIVFLSCPTYGYASCASSSTTLNSETKQFCWFPGIEINNVQNFSFPQYIIFCGWCTREQMGYSGQILFLEISPGSQGGNISIGASHLIGAAITGVSAKITKLHTWTSSWRFDTKNEYIGPEISATIAVFDIEIGVLKRITNTGYDKYLFTIGVGIGL